MKNYKVWLALALVFVMGFGAGAVATRVVVRHMMSRLMQRPEELREVISRRLASRLRLDAAQRAKVDQILGRTQGDIRDLRSEFAPRFVGILSNAQTEISAELSPTQREAFQKFIQENRHLFQPR